MKAVVFVLLLLLSTGNLAAQKSFPTLEDNPVWSVEWSGMYNHGGVDIYCYIEDTIPGSNYQILSYGDKYPIAYIRVNGPKVWMKHFTSGFKNEMLLFDFSLNVGDSVYVGKFLGGISENDTVLAVCTKVDSMLTAEGYKRHVYVEFPVCPWSDEIMEVGWIEGIGSVFPYYLQYWLCVTDYSAWLSCYKENEKVLYSTYGPGSCQWHSSTINEKSLYGSINIYPNPAHNELNITFPQDYNSVGVDIYSMDGKVVYSNASINAFMPIDISDFVEGIYIVRVNAGENIFYERILKH